MDAQQFLAEFGYIAGAPGGVSRLRELILAFAVRGHLVPQALDENNTAHTVRSLISKRKKNEAKTRFRTLDEIKLADAPYEIPDNWLWIRLGEVVEILDGLRRPITKQNREAGPYPYYGASGIVDYIADFIFDEPLILVGEDGAKWGCGENSAFKISGKTWVNNHAHVLRPLREFILDDYLVYSFVEMDLSPFITGMTVPKLNQARLISVPLSLPPLEEQVRIIAKVDELMALCDKLEAQQKEQSKIETSARKATLQELVNADLVSLATSLARLDQNLPSLFRTPDSVDDLLVSLKELAVRGLLTANTGVFPDVFEIKTACAAQGTEYISAGWMRKQKIVIAPDSTVDYPPNWAVIPFDDVALVIGGVTKGRDLRGRDVVTCPYLSVANVQRGFFKLENVKTIQIAEGELGKYRIQNGDLLITEGGDWDKVGRTAIWHGGIENCLHQNHVFKARVPSDQLLNEWVELVFNSNIGRDYFAGASKQTTNLASINMTQLRSFPLPIPPLVEQKAILDKLSVLSEICITWRDQLVRAHKLASLLATASIATITGIRTEEEEALKTPKTKLISKLLLVNNPDIKEQAPLAAILARHQSEMSASDLWQRYGGEIDAFYAQLKQEVGKGWIAEPAIAEMRETEVG